MTTTFKCTQSYECNVAMRMFLAEEVIVSSQLVMTSKTVRRRFLEFCYEAMLPKVMTCIPEHEFEYGVLWEAKSIDIPTGSSIHHIRKGVVVFDNLSEVVNANKVFIN